MTLEWFMAWTYRGRPASLHMRVEVHVSCRTLPDLLSDFSLLSFLSISHTYCSHQGKLSLKLWGEKMVLHWSVFITGIHCCHGDVDFTNRMPENQSIIRHHHVRTTHMSTSFLSGKFKWFKRISGFTVHLCLSLFLDKKIICKRSILVL